MTLTLKVKVKSSSSPVKSISFARYKLSKSEWHWPFKVTKVRCNHPMDSPYMLSYWCLIVTWPNSTPLQDTRLQLLWPFKVPQGRMWWCHFLLIYIVTSCLSNCLALIIARNVFSRLPLGSNYEKSQMHQMNPKWPWALQGQRYVLLLPTSPRFRLQSLCFTDNWGVWFLHKVQWWIWNLKKNR